MLFVVRQTTDKINGIAILSILFERVAISDCILQQENITNTRSRE
jgi:hypothetical protein